MRFALGGRGVLSLTVASALVLALGACSKEPPKAAGNSGEGAIGVDLPRADSDFWNAYARYIPAQADELGVKIAGPTNSQNDVQKLISNVDSLAARGAKSLLIAPQDTGAVASKLDELAAKKIPVVSVDTRPDSGQAHMVVRVAAAQGSGMIFTVFAAAVIGGISLDGGKGSLFGALCGVVLLGLIQNVLTLAEVRADQIQAVNGLVILVALILARLTSGKAQD